jgi:O-Antigen ligase
LSRSWASGARFPIVALGVLCVGLALHNLAMAELWDAGVRGNTLDAVAAWKEVLLAAALGVALWQARRLPLGTWPDRLALAYAAVVLLYAVLPQDWLGGEASGRTVLYALRHDLLPVAGYALGRLLSTTARDERGLRLAVLGTAIGLAIVGIVEVYAVPLQWWRDSGAPGWFDEQLGLDYQGLSGLPENFVYNAGDERPLRRLVSTFLSPLATSYLLIVGLLYLASRRRLGAWGWVAAAVLFAALLLTHSRSSILALAGGLVVLALAQRRALPALAAAAVVALGVAGLALYEHYAPEERFTPAELEIQRAGGAEDPGATSDPFSAGESSLESHWTSLRDGVETVVRHPWGYGLGNAGVTASRTNTPILAGESTYTELGVETGLLGLVLFVAWNLTLLRELWTRSAWLAAALAATLALGLQTDVIGVHWLAVVLWGLCGAAVGREYDRES